MSNASIYAHPCVWLAIEYGDTKTQGISNIHVVTEDYLMWPKTCIITVDVLYLFVDLFIISSLNSFYIYFSHSYDTLPVQNYCILLYFCLLDSEKIATYVNVFVACLKTFSLGKLWITKQFIIITVCIVKISSPAYSFSVISVTCWNLSYAILVIHGWWWYHVSYLMADLQLISPCVLILRGTCCKIHLLNLRKYHGITICRHGIMVRDNSYLLLQ